MKKALDTTDFTVDTADFKSRIDNIHHKLVMQLAAIEKLSNLLFLTEDPGGTDILLQNIAAALRIPLDELDAIDFTCIGGAA